MSTVFLHIGLPKTGTTAIQNFLRTNDEALRRRGICFPDLGFSYPEIHSNRNAHFLVSSYDAPSQMSHFTPGSDYTSGIEQLARLSKTYDTILLTDELIWRVCNQHADFWPTVKEDFSRHGMELKVIAYLRRQDEFVQSRYRQRMKAGETFSFYEFLGQLRSHNYPLDFYAAAQTISRAIGRENLILRIYEQKQYQGIQHTLISDFLDIFGLSISDDFIVEDKLFNHSLHGSYLEMRRLLNALPGNVKGTPTLTQSIKEIQEANPYTQKQEKQTLFLPGDQHTFLEHFADSNAQLAREYFGRTDGSLFYTPLRELPYEKTSTEELLRDALLVYGRAFQTLDRQNKELKMRTEKLEKELKKSSLANCAKQTVKKLIGRK
ncbi:MAG: hypothetical protein ACLVEV_07270 [Lachnospiraceae bacterium]